jgi:hypothetical protein
MGILATARADFTAAFAAFKATTPTRAQKRRYVAALVTAGQEWLAKHDAQENAAAQDFAASKPGQFDAFVGALPEPVLDPVDPALDLKAP